MKKRKLGQVETSENLNDRALEKLREDDYDSNAAYAYRRGVKPPPPLTCFFAFRIFARRVFTRRRYSV